MTDRKRITSEDAALFRRAVGIARRVVDDRVEPFRRPAHAAPRTPEAHAAAGEGLDSPWARAAEAGERLVHARPGLQRRQLRRLQRGQTLPEEEIDLHGMRVAQAHAALSRFLDEACARGRRCVRVVHGKGLGSGGGRSILKGEVDRWLREAPEVVAFASAPPGAGGTGALHVLLKR